MMQTKAMIKLSVYSLVLVLGTASADQLFEFGRQVTHDGKTDV